jgi:D-alanyl-D-alanine carboxypeptidase
VAVTRGDTVIYSGAHGLANHETSEPLTVASPLRLLSVSKVMTAALALRLESSGAVDLDAPLSRTVPEVGNEAVDRPTLRDVLSHTSGLEDYVTADLERYLSTRAPLTDDFVLAQLVTGERHFPPGQHWAYSNTGFYLAGLSLRRATQLSWSNLVDDSLAKPLGLSSLRLCDEYIGKGQLKGYEVRPDTVRESILYGEQGVKGDGGICGTAEDLARFARQIERGSYLTPEAFKRMTTPTELHSGTQVDYGLGVRLGSLSGRRMWGHTGSIVAYQATLLRFPDDDLTIAVLQNTVNAEIDALVLAWHLAEIALDLDPPDVTPRATVLEPAHYEGEYVSWGESDEADRTRVIASGATIRRIWVNDSASGAGTPLRYLGLHEFGRDDWPRDRIVFHVVEGAAVGYSEYYAGLFGAYHWRANVMTFPRP